MAWMSGGIQLRVVVLPPAVELQCVGVEERGGVFQLEHPPDKNCQIQTFACGHSPAPIAPINGSPTHVTPPVALYLTRPTWSRPALQPALGKERPGAAGRGPAERGPRKRTRTPWPGLRAATQESGAGSQQHSRRRSERTIYVLSRDARSAAETAALELERFHSSQDAARNPLDARRLIFKREEGETHHDKETNKSNAAASIGRGRGGSSKPYSW